jgi:hypothetical protein
MKISDAVLLVVGAFAGVLAQKLWDRAARYLTELRPAGRLWGWLEPSEPLQLIMSTGLSDESEYTDMVFPTEALAGAELESYLGDTLHHPVEQRLADAVGEKIRCDLVLVGGPVKNAISERVLAEPGIPCRFEDHAIVHEPSCERWDAEIKEHNGRLKVTTDYCVIIRAPNPYNRRRGVLLIGGSRAFGTLAGARLMSGDCVGDTLEVLSGLGAHYMAIAEARVHNDVPGRPRIVKAWRLTTSTPQASDTSKS